MGTSEHQTHTLYTLGDIEITVHGPFVKTKAYGDGLYWEARAVYYPGMVKTASTPESAVGAIFLELAKAEELPDED